MQENNRVKQLLREKKEMKMLSIENAYAHDIILFDIVPALRLHKENVKYSLLRSPKKKNALIYFHSCRGHYRMINGMEIDATPGDLVYIPKGAAYEVNFSHTGTRAPDCIRIEFLMMENQEDCVFSETIVNWKEHYPKYVQKKLFEIVNQYQAPVKSLMSIKSLFFGVLYDISYAFHKHYLSNAEFASIYDGIHYIENDALQSLSISEIANMCYVSESYFRKTFKRYSGCSPTEYRLNKKIERAKDLLLTNEMTVREVAEELNFKNIYYFSRVFTKKVGIAPKTYVQTNLKIR